MFNKALSFPIDLLFYQHCTYMYNNNQFLTRDFEKKSYKALFFTYSFYVVNIKYEYH